MSYTVLEQKLNALPQPALEEIYSYIDDIFLRFTSSEENKTTKSSKKGFGCLKDIPCKMSADFDEPLEEFAEYM